MAEAFKGPIEEGANSNTQDRVVEIVPSLIDDDKVSLVGMTQEQLLDWFNSGNIHNGSHFMLPDDNNMYQELCKKNLREAIIFLRNKWSECVDLNFIQSFALVHWVSDSEMGIVGLEKLFKKGKNEVEISTQAYRDEKSLINNPRWLNAKFGVLVTGQVNLASNEDIQTNQWHGLQPSDSINRRKYTEWANRLMTDESNCISPYEFVVGDWKAVGIVTDSGTKNIDKLASLAEKYNLPLVNTENSGLFVK